MSYFDLSPNEKEEHRTRLRGFLRELEDLCTEFDFSINGCGCDGSPWVNDEKYHMHAMDHLNVYPDRPVEPPLPPHEHVLSEWFNVSDYIRERRCESEDCKHVQRELRRDPY